jgi:ketosteroid isomerase-like protein
MPVSTRWIRSRDLREATTMVTAPDALGDVLERYKRAADDFARGDPEPVKALFSDRDDVTLANPFGPPVRGRAQTFEALDQAASRFRDGSVMDFDVIVTYETAELASVLAMEHWSAKVSGRDALAPFDLRVTSTFRREGGAWKLVHRHADPISTFDPDGPLRIRGAAED